MIVDRLLSAQSTGRPAIFLDKDGTLINDIPYNVDPEKITFAPGAVAGLTALRDVDALFIVVSNQPGVALRKFPESDLAAVNQKLTCMFQACGVTLTDFYWCPHAPVTRSKEEVGENLVQCNCRKPAPGMLLRAALEHGIDLGASWMIGDILDDVEAGQRAGCRAVLIDNGNETVWQTGPFRTPVARCSDVGRAISYVAKQMQSRSVGPPLSEDASDSALVLAKGDMHG